MDRVGDKAFWGHPHLAKYMAAASDRKRVCAGPCWDRVKSAVVHRANLAGQVQQNSTLDD